MATTRDGRAVEFARDDVLRRFLAVVDGRTAAVAEFLQTPDLVVLTHTETVPEFEGQGVASQLVGWALDDTRRRAYAVLPTCPFVAAYIAKRPQEYDDLVYRAPGRRPRP